MPWHVPLTLTPAPPLHFAMPLAPPSLFCVLSHSVPPPPLPPQTLGLEGIERSQRPQALPGTVNRGATPVDVEPISLVGGTFFVSLTCKVRQRR